MAERTLHETSYFKITVDDAQKFIRVTRTGVHFPDLETMRANNRERMTALAPLRGSAHGVLIDTRDSPLRNDPEFESEMRQWRMFLFEEFGRAAILVRTAVGMLQVQRIGRDPEMDIMKQKVRVFQEDEAAAIRYLTGA